jgi:hypothetical protein
MRMARQASVFGALLTFLVACGGDDETPSAKSSPSKMGGRGGSDVAADGGPDASDEASQGGRSGGAGFGFGDLDVDARGPDAGAAPGSTPDAGLPIGWRCDPALRTDAVCDCGCGALDPRCANDGCTTPGCSAPACEACFGADGAARDCRAPALFECGAERLNDGVCDCGCGAPDPDCDAGCFELGCNVEGCQRCGEQSCGEPDELACNPNVRGNGVCDCGCGNYDPDCTGSSCTEPECFALGCQQCHDERGTAVDCVAPVGCDAAVLDDGKCDCGCGAHDRDCAPSEGCALPGCSAAGCDVCRDAAGRAVPCPGTFSCDVARYADGAQCDCGCGRADPDCAGQGCDAPGCAAAGCDVRHDAAGRALRPSAWTCAAERFDTLDGCDCGCGAIDPDCAAGCSEPGCRAPSCDHCWAADGSAFECRWTCDLARFDDKQQCDCGCGVVDPDCRDRGCDEAGCWAAGCESCNGASGALACERGACDSAYFGDGVCDCGCREQDPDCGGAPACVEPGCSDDGCERCHDDAGELQACANWSCTFEGQGTGDGCNCGCGAPDPDCGEDDGCAVPGCRQSACVTCRGAQGSPASCTK